jgi:predicted double-glycine peptidase
VPQEGRAASTWLRRRDSLAFLIIKLPFGLAAIVLLIGSPQPLDAEGAPTHRTKTVRSLLEIRQQGVVIQQWDISCGAAALATILTYQHGDPVPEKKIAEAMLRRTDPLRVKVRGGFSLLDLKRFVESRGYVGDGYTQLTVEDLLKFGPTIVPVNLDGYNHFVVFRGTFGDRVLLADPAFGNRTVPLKRFEESWLQNIGFIVSRRDEASPPNRLRLQEHDLLSPTDMAVRAALRRGG